MPWYTINPGETYLVPGRRKMKAIEPDRKHPSVWWLLDKEQRWHAFHVDKLTAIKVRTKRQRRSNGS